MIIIEFNDLAYVFAYNLAIGHIISQYLQICRNIQDTIEHNSGYLHSIRCFPSLRNEKRHCCYNIITTISHVISSEGIHGTEKYV